MKSKVYFTNMRCKINESLLTKLDKVIDQAKIEDIDFNGKFVAIKIHFGEAGNLAYLRSNFAKVVVDKVKSLGGKPFLTDCNTLYVGKRKHALEHMEVAYEHGFSPLQTGCHVIIGDGLKGTNEVCVPVEGGTYVKEAKIGQAIMDADIIISLSHFKGHQKAGFGGAMKNLGMGCGSRAGKMEMHSSSKPFILDENCIGCGKCKQNCAHNAITIVNKKASMDQEICTGCGRCLGVCPTDAVSAHFNEAIPILNRKMAEYTKAVINDRPHFHISLAMDISPKCDCHSGNDLAIIPNVGIFASFDPVAIDQAAADKCEKMPIIPGSMLDEGKCNHGHEPHLAQADIFTLVHPDTNWNSCLEHAEKLGIGSREYDLIEI